MGCWGDLDTEDKVKVSSAVTCCILIPSVIMFACSFSTLNPHEMGLHYNGVTYHLDTTTEGNGRYFLGLGHKFIKFPAKLQYVEFSNSDDGGARNQRINLWTKDGQEVFAEIGFYYRLRRDKLADMYYLYGTRYLEVIENIATDTFRDVSTRYDTIQFFEERDSINDEMHSELRTRLYDTVFAEVPRFNLLSLDMPDRFEAAIVDKVIKEQEKKTLEFVQVSSVTLEEINLEQANADVDIAILQANATASGLVLVEAARADAFKLVQQSLAELRKDLADALGMSGSPTGSSYDKLLHYMYLDLVRGAAANSTLVFNVDKLLVSDTNL